MGGVSSQSTFVKNTVTALNETVIDVVNKTKNDMKQSCSTVQNISLSIKGNIQIDTISTNQIMAVNCTLDGKATSQMSDQINVQMDNKIDEVIKNLTKSQQELLSLSANQQDTKMDNTTFIKNSIKESITNSITNTCQQNLNMVQGQNIVIENNTPYRTEIKSIDLNQNLQAIAIANCVLNSVVTNLSDNKQLNDLIQKVTSDTSSEQKGLSGLMGPLILLLLIGGGIFLFVTNKGINIAQDPKKLIMVIGSVIIIYLLLAYWRKWTPFKKKEKFLENNILQKPYMLYNPSLTSEKTANFNIW